MDTERKVLAYPLPSMDCYVSALRSHLEFNGSQFFSDEASTKRFISDESINNPEVWLSAVSWKDGADERLPRARIEMNFGRKTYTLDEKTGFAPDPEEAETKEVLLNTLALGEAKLRIVKDNIPDTYALLQLRTDRAIRELDEARTNLLRGKSTKQVSLKELIEANVKADNQPSFTASGTYKATARLTAIMLTLAACSPLVAPTQADIDASENQPKVTEVTQLPNPQVGVTQGGTIRETPTTPSEEVSGNFGLATPTTEWPGTGVNVVGLAQELYKTGELALARDIEKDSQEWNSIENQGGDIGGLQAAIEKKLQDQGNSNAQIQAVEGTGGGWALEVRAADGSLMWSVVDNQDGTKTWEQHPDRITEGSHFQKLDPSEIGLEEGERLELSIHEGTAMGVVVDVDGEIKGIFDPQKADIVRFVEAQAAESGSQIIEIIPDDLRFLDGGVVKEMVTEIRTDDQTRLNSAIDRNGNIISYQLPSGEWVTNSLVETGFIWDFDINENGELIQHHIIEDKGHDPYPIQGIKFIKPDQLPPTYWDENNPVEDNPRSWPEAGTLAVLDRNGNILMYYSKQENTWRYAGYQQELPGNMIYKESSSVLENLGLKHVPASEGVWPGITEHWLQVRRMIDWFAYSRRTGSNIAFEDFVDRTNNGEIFNYKSWVFDLESKDYVLAQLNQNTKLNIVATVFGKHDFSYTDTNGGDGNTVSGGGGLWTSLQLNPDKSVSIISGMPLDSMKKSDWPFGRFVDTGVRPFTSYVAGVLGASDRNQKEGIDREFPLSRLPNDLSDWWLFEIYNFLVDIREMKPEDEYFLRQVIPIIMPDVQVDR